MTSVSGSSATGSPRCRRRSSGSRARRGACSRRARTCRRRRRSRAPQRARDRHARRARATGASASASPMRPALPMRSRIAPCRPDQHRVVGVDRIGIALRRAPRASTTSAPALGQQRAEARRARARSRRVGLRAPAVLAPGRELVGARRAEQHAPSAPVEFMHAASHPPEQRERPALSSGSFRLPHFGLCTHDGQPRSHGQPREQLRGVLDPALELLEAALGDADAARVAVVDEDRRAPGLRGGGSSRGRRCPSGRTSPRAAAARSSRARPRAACRAASASRSSPSSCSVSRHVPDGFRLERRLGQVERDEVDRLLRRGSPCAGTRRPAP